MPYVTQEQREAINERGWNATDVGELTYQLTLVIIGYLGESPSFADYAEAVAALECAKLELYRRSVARHEDRAIRRNGDLPYPPVEVEAW